MSREVETATSAVTAMVEFQLVRRPVQHKTPVSVHRPAEVDRRLANGNGSCWPPVPSASSTSAQRHVQRPVDDDAHRAVLVVRADVGHRAHEVRIFASCGIAIRKWSVRLKCCIAVSIPAWRRALTSRAAAAQRDTATLAGIVRTSRCA
jgi:hypothetical protein